MNDALSLFNEARKARGVEPLKPHRLLTAAAEAHSKDQAARGRMSHQGSDGSDHADRIKAAGYSCEYCGECVAAGQTTADQVVGDWLGDPPHRRIVTDGHYTHVGVAVVDHYWTADFASGMPDDEPEPQPRPRPDFDPW